MTFRRAYILAFSGALAFLYLRTFLLPAVPFAAKGDEVLFFVRALRIVHGQTPYQDFFELVTPGTDLLYAAGFKLLGVHAWILQGWSIVLGLALSYIITSLARKILSGPAVFLPALIFLAFDFSSLDATHHWYSTLAALAAVRVLMGPVNLERVAAAGFLCDLAALFTQTQGCLSLLAVMIYLLIEESTPGPSRLKKAIALLVPFVLLCSGVGGYYLYHAGLHTVFFDLFVFPVKYLSSGSFNSPGTYLHQFPVMRGLADVVRLIPYLLIYALVPYIYIFSLYDLWRRREILPKSTWQYLVLLNLMGVALFLAVSSGPRFFRLSTVAPPALLIFVWLLNQPGRVVMIARHALWAVGLASALWMPIHRQMQWHGVLSLPIGRTAFASAGQMHEFQWLQQRTHPGDRFFNEPLIGLYLELDNLTRAEFVNNDDFTRPKDVTSIVESLQQAPPKFIMLYPRLMSRSDVHDHSGPFQRYVQQHYCPLQSFQYDRDSYVQELWGECSKPLM